MSNKFEQTSFLFGSNAVFIEELYKLYMSDPSSVDQSWQTFFREQGLGNSQVLKHSAKVVMQNMAATPAVSNNITKSEDSSESNSLKAKFMIDAYRKRAHYLANLDPLDLETKKTISELKLNIEDFGFRTEQLGSSIEVNGEFSGIGKCSLATLRDMLHLAYANTVGVQFDHVENFQEQAWLFEALETYTLTPALTNDIRKSILKDLVEVEGFEQYLHTKFPGAKRFSIEGGEAFIVALGQALEIASVGGVEDVVIGMAHRGRLSALAKVLGKPYRAILSEFMGSSPFPSDLDVSGDVKYHMGYSSDKVTSSGRNLHLSLTPNPSHLEAVNPVVAGRVRAKQDLINDVDRKRVMGILVHGDAAFCGQGVVAETLVMSGLDAYKVGGIIHIVINNQIGFTANAKDSRAGRYATEVANVVGAPVLHVNGDDIESVLLATKIAVDYKQKFGKDVVLDIVCYRKYGHNEGDEPMYTQGVMYNAIRNKKTPARIYADKLVSQGIIDDAFMEKLYNQFKAELDLEFLAAKDYKPRAQWFEGNWIGYSRSNHSSAQPTGVSKDKLQKLGERLYDIQPNFPINQKLAKLMAQRLETIKQGLPIDWAIGEQLAFATLLQEGTPIRLTGQDSGRGTFSHRHSVLHSQTDYSTYIPLNNISEDQGKYEVADSNLSEYGVLGFEYGYSLVNPKHLVLWEGQFGDFANGAQIIFDQFISSAETKWLRMSNLVVLLPHGFEGQGPEHSSARLERFLQLAAEDNMQIAYPTTPASIFHLLRRQMHRKFCKPLIIMSPKSLLRHRLAVSEFSEISENTSFVPIIDEIDSKVKTAAVKRIIFCTGKVYYDLLEARINNNISDIAIIRIEQLYPFIGNLAMEVLHQYKSSTEFVWVQEEPKNMGAWHFIRDHLNSCLQGIGIKNEFKYIGRDLSASPAVGSNSLHNKQQETILREALKLGEK